eukprot:CAMPEP_0184691960 /NCGR_PEP_ID=MMETSP0313-20130426/633_1 /TAXON_ID=2792 /ORGANISM="Porphyridium aerugineum, Strain SAG 1380-2" /LENGTH=60 /DNA_ID=CAMNT_0027149745 /DNA_START=231 /DNA_END=413 /DNA_ORIENTATION=-
MQGIGGTEEERHALASSIAHRSKDIRAHMSEVFDKVEKSSQTDSCFRFAETVFPSAHFKN